MAVKSLIGTSDRQWEFCSYLLIHASLYSTHILPSYLCRILNIEDE